LPGARAIPCLRGIFRSRDLRFRAGPAADPTPADVELAAWTIHTVHGAPAVVLVHGYKTSREEMLPWARFIHDAG
jgi:hypothetical protein